ncbi:MAG: response regulator [Rhodospirillales bacterium]|nr:response regulator [Rhodospirillales bacterium]
MKTGESCFEILLVEDDPGDARLVKGALAAGKLYCRLHHARDGVEAMAFLRREPPFTEAPAPDLILLDLNMPRKDGREVLRDIKNDPALKEIPTVILTTSDVDRDIVSSYRLGANSFITKPVDVDQFFEAIRSIQHYWFSIVQLPR